MYKYFKVNLMIHRFSDSAASAAPYVSAERIRSVDMTYSSVRSIGSHPSGASKLSGNIDILGQILKENLGVSAMKFYEGNLSVERKISGGMGFERQSSEI
jgi:hypothetical protein